MTWQPLKTAITTAKTAFFTIKSLSNKCQIINKVTFFQITTLKYISVRNNSFIIKDIASEIADGRFNNNFIKVP